MSTGNMYDFFSMKKIEKYKSLLMAIKMKKHEEKKKKAMIAGLWNLT